MRRKLKDATLALMRTKPIEEIKAVEIAAKLGVNRSTIYRYYDSAFSIVQEMEDDFFSAIKNCKAFNMYTFSDIYFRQPCPGILAIAQIAEEHAELLDVMLGRYGEPLFKHKCLQNIKANFFDKAISEGYIKVPKEIDDICSSWIVAGQLEIVKGWLKEEKQMPVEELAVLSYKIAFGSFRSQWWG